MISAIRREADGEGVGDVRITAPKRANALTTSSAPP
jgi:hypothetical protein